MGRRGKRMGRRCNGVGRRGKGVGRRAGGMFTGSGLSSPNPDHYSHVHTDQYSV